jgi:uncharacterized OsmC-like protein
MNEYRVFVTGVDGPHAAAWCKETQILLDTHTEGCGEAFNPFELLLASIGACMVKGIKRVAPLLGFVQHGVRIEISGTRSDDPPRVKTVNYVIELDTDESDHRLQLLHENIRKFGTIYNTVAAAVPITGDLRRSARSSTGSGERVVDSGFGHEDGSLVIP